MTETPGHARFTPLGRDDWEAAATRALRGRPLSDLHRASDDGLPLAPLYLGEDTAGAHPAARDRHRVHDDGTVDLTPPRITATAEGDTPADVRGVLVSGGARGLEAARIPLSSPGHRGARITTLDDLAGALEGVGEPLAAVTLLGADGGFAASALLFAFLDRRGPAASASTSTSTGPLNMGADPLSALARQGRLPFDRPTLERHIRDLARAARDRSPDLQPFEVDTSIYHDSGATPALELAYALGTGVYLLRTLEAEGLEPEEAGGLLAFRFSVTCRQFEEIAKLRAFRRLWHHVLEACGAPPGAPPNGPRFTLHAVTSARMMARRDPWVNMLRTTVAAFAASVSSIDTLEVRPFDHARGLPGELGRRIAQNTSFILQEESHAGQVADPAGGSWYVESHTEDLTRAAWDIFRRIESTGGMLEHLISGNLRDEIEPHARTRQHEIARRIRPITGVSRFANLDEEPLATAARPPIPVSSSTERSSSLRSLDIRRAIAAYARGATYTEVTRDLENGCLTAPALRPVRDAGAFEAFRDQGERLGASRGRRPRVLLVDLGPPKAHKDRAAFARDAFAAGGFEPVQGPGIAGPDRPAKAGVETAADAFRATGADLVVLVGTDAAYAEHARVFCEGLRAAGAKRTFAVTGPTPSLRDLGVDGFLFPGADILDVVGRAYEAVGKAQP